jgi:CheY-like chemotaxis protein
MLRRTVLVVAADDASRAMLVDLLRGASDLAAAGAATVEEALDFLRGISVHLVLLDLQALGAGGLEAIERLRLSPATRGIPLVAMAPAPWPHTEQAARLAGCAALLSDGVDPEALVETVREIIAESTSRRWMRNPERS